MKDLTRGKPIKLILLYALPLVIGQLFQQFYTLVDVRIVGETLGELPLAAVGATTPLADFLIGFINGMSNGFAIVVATYFGAKDEANLKRSVAASFLTGAAAALLFTGISLICIKPILNVLQIEEELMPLALQYICVLIVGLIFTSLYNVCAAVLRAVGDTATPLILLIVSSFLNIGLDYLFILGLNMGVAGAAVATVLSQGICAAACMVRIIKHYPLLHVSRADFAYSPVVAGKIISTGFSMALMISLVNMGTLILQGAINTFGPYTIVAHTAARKATMVFMMPNGIFGIALATFSGQNYGARKYDRIWQGTKQSIIVILIWDLCMAALSWLFGPQIISLISASTEESVLSTGAMYIRIDTLFYFLCTSVCCIRNSLQGIGESLMTLVSSFAELMCKVLIAVFLAPRIGYTAIIICEPIAWAVMLIPLVIRWRQLRSSLKLRV